MKKIIECVPNFSTSDIKVVQKLADCFENKHILIDVSSDTDHNRTVITSAGAPDIVMSCIICAVGIAAENIDLNFHKGVHPRMGAADVIPFIPLKNITTEEAVALSGLTAQQIAKLYNIPVFLYGKSATAPNRINLADIRKGGFEKMTEKLSLPEWKPDFGQRYPHKTAGVTACGVRDFLVAYNVNLKSQDIEIAKKIAWQIREKNGGLKGIKALGLYIAGQGLVQISMNIADCEKTSLQDAFERVKALASHYGIEVLGSEIVGLAPMKVLTKSINNALKIQNFEVDKILEYKIWEDE